MLKYSGNCNLTSCSVERTQQYYAVLRRNQPLCFHCGIISFSKSNLKIRTTKPDIKKFHTVVI